MVDRKTASEILEAVDVVCGWCGYEPEDASGIDPCASCRVVEIANRMHDIVREKE